jgi:hypothetical protein
MGSLTVTENVTGVVLSMSPPSDVTARLSVADGGGLVDLKGVRIALSNDVLYRSEAQSDATGKLSFARPIPSGRYSIDVNTHSLPQGCYVQEVKLGHQEAGTEEFEILTSAQVEIVLSHQGRDDHRLRIGS